MKKSMCVLLFFQLYWPCSGKVLSSTPADTLLNAFLSTYAKQNAAWKKDIQPEPQPGQLKPGRQLGQSAIIGHYSFAPKTWEDLTSKEKQILLKDPRLRGFVISTRIASSNSTAFAGHETLTMEIASSTAALQQIIIEPNPRQSPEVGAPNTRTPYDQKIVMIRLNPKTLAEGRLFQVDLSSPYDDTQKQNPDPAPK